MNINGKFNNDNELMPYERFKKYGIESLTDKELMALLLRSGIKGTNVLELSDKILGLGENNSLYNIMEQNYYSLLKVKGIGEVRATQIVAVSEIVKRLWRYTKFKNETFFKSPSDISDYYMQEMRCLVNEEVRVSFLNTKNRLLSDYIVNRGSINRSIISIRDIICEAVKRNSVNIVLIHNHPSGDPFPSREDRKITNMLNQACIICEISLLDHIIIGDNRFYSFKENGDL